jgi:anti-sigma B factor antagonist
MIMTLNQDHNASSPAALDGEAASSTGNPDRTAPPSALLVPDGPPRLIVRAVAGFSVVDLVNAEILLEEATIRGLSTQLHRLIEEGHTRLLLNFGGVRYMSSAVLATLAGLHRRLERAQARLGLCGLDSVLRDMVRICGLERMFDIYADEREALGVGPVTADRPRLE